MTDNASAQTWWKDSWPLDRGHWKRLVIALLVVIAVGVAVGQVLTDWTAPNAITELDQDIASDLAENRTETKNDLSHWAAFPADTPVKIGASVMLAAIMLARWKRWHEAVFVGLTLIFEATAFIVITYIVSRPRPDVPRLLDSPVDTSFPSGHVAAATVYASIAVIVFWHTRAVWARALAIVIAALLPLAVAWARLYQGMHFLSDVIAGVILGAVSIAICYRILGPPPVADNEPETTRSPEQLEMAR